MSHLQKSGIKAKGSFQSDCYNETCQGWKSDVAKEDSKKAFSVGQDVQRLRHKNGIFV